MLTTPPRARILKIAGRPSVPVPVPKLYARHFKTLTPILFRPTATLGVSPIHHCHWRRGRREKEEGGEAGVEEGSATAEAVRDTAGNKLAPARLHHRHRVPSRPQLRPALLRHCAKHCATEPPR